jgi:hypothetical protein
MVEARLVENELSDQPNHCPDPKSNLARYASLQSLSGTGAVVPFGSSGTGVTCAGV